uniref:ZM domain-containing protein n=1 Tax=Rhabditophanes sp. KR3021 TaxID=114890 RepID=A0AC35U2V3_9BILA
MDAMKPYMYSVNTTKNRCASDVNNYNTLNHQYNINSEQTSINCDSIKQTPVNNYDRESTNIARRDDQVFKVPAGLGIPTNPIPRTQSIINRTAQATSEFKMPYPVDENKPLFRKLAADEIIEKIAPKKKAASKKVQHKVVLASEGYGDKDKIWLNNLLSDMKNTRPETETVEKTKGRKRKAVEEPLYVDIPTDNYASSCQTSNHSGKPQSNGHSSGYESSPSYDNLCSPTYSEMMAYDDEFYYQQNGVEQPTFTQEAYVENGYVQTDYGRKAYFQSEFHTNSNIQSEFHKNSNAQSEYGRKSNVQLIYNRNSDVLLEDNRNSPLQSECYRNSPSEPNYRITSPIKNIHVPNRNNQSVYTQKKANTQQIYTKQNPNFRHVYTQQNANSQLTYVQPIYYERFNPHPRSPTIREKKCHLIDEITKKSFYDNLKTTKSTSYLPIYEVQNVQDYNQSYLKSTDEIPLNGKMIMGQDRYPFQNYGKSEILCSSDKSVNDVEPQDEIDPILGEFFDFSSPIEKNPDDILLASKLAICAFDDLNIGAEFDSFQDYDLIVPTLCRARKTKDGEEPKNEADYNKAIVIFTKKYFKQFTK